MSSRDVILGRIRAALADVPRLSPEEDVPVEWEYGRPSPAVPAGPVAGAGIPAATGSGTAATPPPNLLDLFVERVEDYRAVVVRCGEDDVAARVSDALTTSGATSAVLPAGVPAAWRAAAEAAGVVVRADDPPLGHRELDEIDAVVTAAAVGIAETGTIVLDHGPDQGRRALSLVPDLHVCVVRADQVVGDVPEAVARLAPAFAAGVPLTWISGPSATSDIELSRVEGVHGPRTLWVVLAE